MRWEFIVALVMAIPLILFPAAFVWYLNVSGLYQVIRDKWQKRVRRSRAAQAYAEIKAWDLASTGRLVRDKAFAIKRIDFSRAKGVILWVAGGLGAAALIWFLIFSLGGSLMLLTVGLVIAVLLIAALAAIVWYLNVSGLYRVIIDNWQKRAQERRLVRMLKHAMVQLFTETLG